MTLWLHATSLNGQIKVSQVVATVALKLERDRVSDDKDPDAPAAEEVSGVAQHPIPLDDVS